MPERRRYPRYDIITRVDITAHPCGWVPAFRGNTVDVSREGLGVELYDGEDSTKLLQSILSKDPCVELALELPPTGERIRGKGSIRWLDIGPVAASRPHLRAGILLRQMNDENRAKWADFVEDRARMARQDNPTA